MARTKKILLLSKKMKLKRRSNSKSKSCQRWSK